MSVLFRDVLIWDPDVEPSVGDAAPSVGDAAPSVGGPTDVLVLGQRIAAVGPAARHGIEPHEAEVRIVEGHGHHLLVPGLINAHFHSSANHLKGAFESLPLELFMLYESPSAAVRPSPREAYLRTMIGALDMLRGGATSVQDDVFLLPAPDPEIIDAVMMAYEDCGIRASVALDQPELSEVEKLPYLDELAPPALADALRAPAAMRGAALLEQYAHLFDRWHGAADGRLSAAVSVSAPQRVTPEYFAALDDISRERGVPLFAHMLETRTQRLLALEQPRFGGESLVAYTAELGLLSNRTNVIHAIWVDDRDLDLIADAGAVIVHNPISNLRLGSGVMPYPAVRERGIAVALGVDEAICGDAIDMWDVTRMTGLIHNIGGAAYDRWPTAADVLKSLWVGGAAAMQRSEDLGSIRAGALADLALLDLNTSPFIPLNDIPRQLVYCDPGGSVVLTMVDGVVVAEHGRVTSVDEAALLEEARTLFGGAQEQRRRERAGAQALLPPYQAMLRRGGARPIGLTRTVEA